MLLDQPLRAEQPLIETTDAHRIAVARSALLTATEARGFSHAVADEAVIDLLADLMHFCAARRVDFERCSRLAASHFAAEIKGGAL